MITLEEFKEFKKFMQPMVVKNLLTPGYPSVL